MYRNSKERIAQLQREKRLRPGKGGRPPHLDQDVDGCAGQYWSAKAAFLTALLARDRKVIIKRHRSAPGEGKRKVDGTHATFKAEARERMAMREDVSGEAVKPEMVEQASRVEDEAARLFGEAVWSSLLLNPRGTVCSPRAPPPKASAHVARRRAAHTRSFP